MVGRLVQNQQVRFFQQQPCDGKPCFLTAAEAGDDAGAAGDLRRRQRGRSPAGTAGKSARTTETGLPNEDEKRPNKAGGTCVITALFGAEKITNSDLIIAAAHVREEKSQEAQAALFNAIRKARFIAPAMMQEIPNEIKPGDQVTAKAEFIMLNRDDQKWLPLFTSLPELQKWSTGPS